MNQSIGETPSLAQPSTAARPANWRSMTRINQYQWVWPGTIVLFVLSYFVAPGTLRSASIFTMLPFAAMLAVVAIGQTLVVQQRGI
ncbi:hypothetical protein EOA60_32435, partial [Mesorhizobium sp. M1A.F.Ca.IN.020.06.1.1]